MRTLPPRFMTFNVPSMDGSASEERWHWLVYEDPDQHFIRNGVIVGNRDEAERAAQTAIADMGGMIRGAAR